MSIPVQKDTPPSLYSEACSYFQDAKESGALITGTILSLSALAGWAYSLNIKDSFASLSQYIRESATYQAATDAGKYATHIGGKLKEAETSHVLYQAVPVAVGTYFGCLGLQKLIQGVFGYDSAKMRKEFLSRAYSGMHNEKALSLSERMSYLFRATFGSINSSSRGFVLIESAERLLIAAAFIYPIFLKDHTEMPDIDRIRNDNLEMRQAQHSANVGGYSRAQTMLETKYLFNKGLARQWTQSIDKSTIDTSAQSLVTNFFDAPTGVPSFNDKIKSGLQNTCNWTAGFTRFADQCQSLAPDKLKSLFLTRADGTTIIDEKVLEEVCSATQEFIATDPTIDSFSTQARRQFNSVCSYVNSTTCHAFKDWATPSDGTERRAELSKLTKAMCSRLKERAYAGNIFGYQPDLTSISTRLNSMIDPSEAVIKLLVRQNNDGDTKLDTMMRAYPNQARQFTQRFFNLTDQQFTQRGINKAYKALSLAAHPDKDLLYSPVFQAAADLKGVFSKHPSLFNATANAKDSAYYTVGELFGQARSFFEMPTDPSADGFTAQPGSVML